MTEKSAKDIQKTKQLKICWVKNPYWESYRAS